jgi:hypothetical protein
MDIIDLGTASTETQGGLAQSFDNVIDPVNTKQEK